jgi:hypothetical protein
MGSFVSRPDRASLVINVYDKSIDFAAAITGQKFKRLHIYGKPTKLNLLSKLTHLVELRMQSIGLTDLSALAKLDCLEELSYVSGGLKEIDLSFAAGTLTTLYLSRHRSLTDLSPIDMCKKLRHLHLCNLPHVRTFCDLKSFTRLEVLDLRNVRHWPSLKGLERADKLRTLFVDRTHIDDGDWKRLLKLRQLTYISGMGDAFGKSATAAFRQQRPEIEMITRFPC